MSTSSSWATVPLPTLDALSSSSASASTSSPRGGRDASPLTSAPTLLPLGARGVSSSASAPTSRRASFSPSSSSSDPSVSSSLSYSEELVEELLEEESLVIVGARSSIIRDLFAITLSLKVEAWRTDLTLEEEDDEESLASCMGVLGIIMRGIAFSTTMGEPSWDTQASVPWGAGSIP